jgi:hypothetical protein
MDLLIIPISLRLNLILFSFLWLIPLFHFPYSSISYLSYQTDWCNINFFFLWRSWVMASTFLMFLDHTQRRTTVGRTSLDKWSAHHRDLYLTIHDTHNRQTSMPPVVFVPTISAGKRPQPYASDRAATGTGCNINCINQYCQSQPTHTVQINLLYDN